MEVGRMDSNGTEGAVAPVIVPTTEIEGSLVIAEDDLFAAFPFVVDDVPDPEEEES